MQYLADVQLDLQRPDQARAGIREPTCLNSGPDIECLQQEIARLLFKNQAIRFELVVAQQKIARLEEALFGPGSERNTRAIFIEPHPAFIRS